MAKPEAKRKLNTVTRPKQVVVLPTYNEADNLPQLVEEILGCGIPSLRVLVVDDNSPDGTGDIAEKLAIRYPGRLAVIHRPGKSGLGTAYAEGFRRALAEGAEAVFQMDADGSHSPQYLPVMLGQLHDHDVVIGSRYVPGGGLDPTWGWRRRVLSRMANFYARRVLGLKLRDVTGGYKCFGQAAVQRILQQRVSSVGYVFQVEVNFLAERLGLRVIEMPIQFLQRRRGKSKISMIVVLEGLLRVWQIRRKYRRMFKAMTPHAQGGAGEPE